MRLLKWTFILCSVVSIVSHCLQAVEKDSKEVDYQVINYIKEKTNLTQSDVNRWKLSWLGSAASSLSAGLGLYTIYQTGKFGYYAPTDYEQKITNVVKSLNIPALFANKFENLAKNKFLWAALGAYSADYMWGKLITSRMPWYYTLKIERFLNFCERLPFAHKKCNSIEEFAEAVPGLIWYNDGVVALQKGFDNLIHQADVADALLGQLIHAGIKGEKESLSVVQSKVLAIKNNLVYNRVFITEEAVRLCRNLDRASSDRFFQWLLMPFAFVYMMSRLTEK